MQFVLGAAAVGAYNMITGGGGGEGAPDVGPALFYFFSPSCKFCSQFAPRLEEYNKSTPPGFKVIKIDLGTDEGREDAKEIEEDFQIQIRAVPSVLMVSDEGKKIGKDGFDLNGSQVKPPEGILVY